METEQSNRPQDAQTPLQACAVAAFEAHEGTKTPPESSKCVVGHFRSFCNKLRAAVQRYAPSSVKAMLWDCEYRSGVWDNRQGDGAWTELFVQIAQYPGTVLDLGCGSGATARLLPNREYVGIDVAADAINKAKAANRCLHHSFICGDIETVQVQCKFGVVLLRESAYYVQRPAALLVKCTELLLPGGALIITLSGTSKKGGKRISDLLELAGAVEKSPKIWVLS